MVDIALRTRRASILAFACGAALVSPAAALRVASYNLLNYNDGARNDKFRTVLEGVDPDVLVVEEILSQSAVDNFLAQVLEPLWPGEWEAGPFDNGPDTDCAIYVRSGHAEVLGHFSISTALRQIDEWTIRPAAYTSEEANVRIYAVHLKASQGSAEEQQRLGEVTLMRARMETFPPGQNYLVTGDFNIYRSTEPAYQYMLSVANGLAGVVQDPIARPGNWHDSISFADIHTQSPRVMQFGGGANGGLDDRFDMVLVGPAAQDGEGFDVLASTYTAYGQDGLHFNRAIIDAPPNEAVPLAVAQAIHDASDHLPLFADFQVPARIVTQDALALGPVLTGGTDSEVLWVENPAETPGDDLDYSFTAPAAFDAPLGDFSLGAGAAPEAQPISLETDAAGIFAGNLIVHSDAPDEPNRNVSLSGIVLEHARPSLDDQVIATEGTLDFGTHPVGTFPTLEARAFNFGYGAIQGLLEIHAAEFQGDRFSFVGGFSPQTIGADPAVWQIEFDDAGAADGVYTATLIFSTRDQQDLSGAIDLPDLSIDLIATVGEAAATPEGPARSIPAGIASIHPNPFEPRVEVRFGIVESGPARLSVYDAGGRLLRLLTSGDLASGEHTVLWDGADELGRSVPAGIYFLRLQSRGIDQTRHVVRVR